MIIYIYRTQIKSNHHAARARPPAASRRVQRQPAGIGWPAGRPAPGMPRGRALVATTAAAPSAACRWRCAAADGSARGRPGTGAPPAIRRAKPAAGIRPALGARAQPPVGHIGHMRRLPAVDQRAPGRAPIYASSLRTVTTVHGVIMRSYHPWMDGVCKGRRYMTHTHDDDVRSSGGGATGILTVT